MKEVFRMRYVENDPTLRSAERIMGLVLECVPARSAVDVGCHRGQWLSVARQLGVEEVQGIDGPWVDPKRLLIPLDRFAVRDLAEPLVWDRRFDLVISTEVAEHLPPERGPGFAADLAALGDVVLFSAAIPGQGGYEHINEQWPDYWVDLFAQQGYRMIDLIRPRIWSDPEVYYFYAQNAFVFASETALQRHPRLAEAAANPPGLPLSVVHPGLFASKMLKHRDRTLPGACRKAWNRLRRRRGENPALPPSARTRI